MPRIRRTTQSSAVQTPFETYLRDINEVSLLTADQEKELAEAIARGDAHCTVELTADRAGLVREEGRVDKAAGLGPNPSVHRRDLMSSIASGDARWVVVHLIHGCAS